MGMTSGEASDRHSGAGLRALVSRAIGRRSVLLSAPLIGRAHAQGGDWPTRPVRLIVAFGAGGAADTATRALAGSIAQRLGQGVVVENRTGGNSVIAGSATVQAPRDGYTLLVDAANQLTNPLLIADLPFDYATAFTPVTQITRFPQVIAVRREFPAQTIEAFVDHARPHPETVTYGTPPAAGMAHLAGALFQRRAGSGSCTCPIAPRPMRRGMSPRAISTRCCSRPRRSGRPTRPACCGSWR
jgi:tripartite-type tricarboxylate transporter receptor subunit TctC